ncbi:BspA family leucine-rich repeat surface protein, partial [Metamycoplasma auris]|uniref:BspA family leucine-rich repeat surface protein n=1 Tax=Metamycoplasma auris TaxID=51363 RepID=UPI001475198D
NNAPKLDESVPEEIHIDWNYDVIPKLKELVNKTWDKETFSKIHSFQTYGDVIRILGEDLSKHFNEIPKEYVKYWDFIDVDFLKNDLLQLQDRDKNQKVNLLNDKTINIRVFNSEVISLGFSRINTVIEVINHLFNTYILPEITTYHSELVIFNKLKKIIKEYEENYTSLKNIELKPNGTLSATKYAEPYRYKPDGAHIDEDLLQSHLNVSVGNNQIKLIYWAQKEGVDKPTKYKDKNGYIKYTNEKDITKEHFIEEILEIGYYKNKEGLVQSTKMPINIGKVPNKLPEVITSLEDMFKNWCYDPGVIYFNPNFWPKKLVGIEEWDTSNIVDLSGMFSHSYFNQDISKWNVENVINMSGLFLNSSFNQNISSWDVSNVTTMEGMFF